jgi:hypothetical protein
MISSSQDLQQKENQSRNTKQGTDIKKITASITKSLGSNELSSV